MYVYIYISIYIYIRNVRSACLDPSGTKPTSRTRPGACDTSLEPSRQKKLIHEKKKSRFACARACCGRKCVTLTTLHKLPQNDFLELPIFKKS